MRIDVIGKHLDETEFTTNSEQHFNAADKNQDNHLDELEFTAHADKMLQI